MSEIDNKNYGTIEEQFNRIKNYVIKEEDLMNFMSEYDKLGISDDLKIETQVLQVQFYLRCFLVQL